LYFNSYWGLVLPQASNHNVCTSLSSLTDSKFWQKNFRYAIIIITIFVAVVTPDGSGITMRFVALPMIALYALGITAIRGNEMSVTERQKN